MLKFDKAIYLSFLLRSILSVRLSYSLWGSDVLLFLEFINIVFIFVLYLHWIHYIVIYFFSDFFAPYKEYMICLVSFSKFSDVLSAFTCARAISDLWSICLGVIILRLEWSETMSEKPVPSILIENILFSKASRTLSLPSKSAYKFLRISFFSCFFSRFWGLKLYLYSLVLQSKLLYLPFFFSVSLILLSSF